MTVDGVRRRRRGSISHDAYGRLHHELVTACHACRQLDAQLADRTINLISAWGSLDALERTDRNILKALEAQCEQIDHELHYSPRLQRRLVRSIVGFVCSACFICFAVAYWQGFVTPQSLAEDVRGIAAECIYRIRLGLSNQKSDTAMLAVVTIVIVIVGTLLMGYRKKT